MSIEVEFRRGLTLRAFVVGTVLLLIAVPISVMTWLYTSKGGTINAFFLPFIYVILLNELLGRVNRRLRLTGQELAVIFPALLLVNSIKYIHKGALSGGEAAIGLVEKTLIAAISSQVMVPDLARYYSPMVPSWMGPKSTDALNAIAYGLKPGQSLPWGEFVVPIIYWSVYVILIYLLSLFLAFGVYGRRWVEVERLVFPLSQPMIFAINAASDIDPATNKSRWFDLRNINYKIFWIAFMIGVVLSAIPILGEIVPPLAVWGAFAWGEQPILLTWMPSVLPGAMAKGVLQVDLVALWLLLPTSTLLTCVIAYVIFGIVYQALAVQLRLIPYRPGVEFVWNWGNMPANWYPFPYRFVGVTGMMVGLGLILLWNARGRLKELFSALRGPDRVEYGLSLRGLALFGLTVVAMILILFIASGVPPVIAVIMLLFAIIYYTALARVASELWWAPDDFISVGGYSYIYYPGVLLGYWPYTLPPGGNNYAAFVTAFLAVPFNNTWTVRVNGLGPGGSVCYYKIAYETRTNLRDALIATVYYAVLGTFLTSTLMIWFLAHGGGISRTNSWGNWVHWMKTGYMVTGNWCFGPYGETRPDAIFPFAAVGLALFFALYFLRMRFPWFPIDPTAFTASVAVGLIWTWLSTLVALIIKLVLVRALGVRRFEQYALPVATGIALGFGVPILLTGLIEFFSVIWPRFMAFYVP